MSVKGKVKRLNKEIDQLKKDNKAQARYIAHIELRKNSETKLLENIIKFAITNHIGGLYGGMAIDWHGIDKMSDLKLDIDKNIMEHAYILRVRY